MMFDAAMIDVSWWPIPVDGWIVDSKIWDADFMLTGNTLAVTHSY